MQTPFGRLPVGDAHAHFFSHRFFETLAKGLPEPPSDGELYTRLGEKLPFEFPPEDPVGLAERWVQELDTHDVSRSVLIASVPGDEESVAAAAAAHPDRFVPFFMLNPNAADAVDRNKRAFRELGMKGVCLFPAMHHFYLHDAVVRPVIEEVAAMGGVVFVHCGLLKVGIRDKLGLKSPFDLRYANPLDVAGLAREFDTVPFILPHFGCGFFKEFLLVARESANVYADTSSTNSWMEAQPTPLTLTQVFRTSLDVLSAERLLYGSDSSFFPRGWQKEHFARQAHLLHSMGVSAQDAAAIFGGNLERLIGG